MPEAMQVSCDLSFVSIGCNTVANGISWGRNGLVAYGAQNFVALYDLKRYTITATLCGHTGRVNSVKWIPNTTNVHGLKWEAHEDELVSGGSDKVIIVWKKSEKHWVKSCVLSGHLDSVNSISVKDYPNGSVLLASASSDKTVRLWKREAQSQNWTQIQVINYAPKMVECVAIGILPLPSSSGEVQHNGVVALGGIDRNIHLYVESSAAESTTFPKVLSLEGHQDWIRCLEFTLCDNGSLLLASSSQDNKIRLWSIAQLSPDSDFHGLFSDVGTTKRISGKGYLTLVGKSRVSVLLEAVLSVHEDWVYGVSWHPPVQLAGKKHQPLCLLSASMDKTMIVWEPDEASGLWLDVTRVGELGGNALGLYGCTFSPDGNSILAHGYNGAFHLWEASKDPRIQENKSNSKVWTPAVTVSGHFGPVEDLSWDPLGDYIVSVSEDKTARLFAPWINKDSTNRITWCEIARPQVHGYDLTCLTFVNGLHCHKFVSGADEKVLRVFDAPQNFVDSLANISGIESNNEQSNLSRPVAASQPALGLSNKPFFTSEGTSTEVVAPALEFSALTGEDADDVLGEEFKFVPMTFTTPPFEEQLLQGTLWPEVMKLYGHGNEIVAVCCSHSGSIIASSCKGTTPETSTIRLWDTNTWKECGVLAGHTLTVTQMAFSYNDDTLLTVSRDRSWCAFVRGSDGKYNLAASREKAHARILWGCFWTHDDKYFVTASRDKIAKIWKKEGWSQVSELSSITGKLHFNKQNVLQSGTDTRRIIGQALTAVEWAPQQIAGKYVLAVGDESGAITLWGATTPENGDWILLIEVSPFEVHTAAVKRIRWCPKKNNDKWKIATCSSDCSVRLFDVVIT